MKAFLKNVFAGVPLYADPSRMASYIDNVRSIDIPHDAKAGAVKEMMEMMFGKRPETIVKGPIAAVPLKGVIGKGLTEIEKMMGGVDMDDFMADIEAVAANPEIKTVLIDVDSIGGTVTGVPEAAAAVRALGKLKHTVAMTDGDMLSAAYMIGSQANEVVCTSSARIGSVGVFKVIPDMSKAYESEGVKMNVIKSGKYKAAGAAGTSLTTDQEAFEQEGVCAMHNEFKAVVKGVRQFVKDDDMEGQIFSGRVAGQKGMVTGVVSDIAKAASKYA